MTLWGKPEQVHMYAARKEHLHAHDLRDYHQNVTEHITISEHKEYTLALIILAIEEEGP